MENGLLEPAPFTTILVSAKDGAYPQAQQFIGSSVADMLDRLAFKHGECGGNLTLTFVAAPEPRDGYVAMQCEQCETGIKMYQNVFFSDIMQLAYHRTRWVNGAYRFSRASPPPLAEGPPWWVGTVVRCDGVVGCGEESVLTADDRIKIFYDDSGLGAVQCHKCDCVIILSVPKAALA